MPEHVKNGDDLEMERSRWESYIKTNVEEIRGEGEE
jgi:hypothetical protein